MTISPLSLSRLDRVQRDAGWGGATFHLLLSLLLDFSFSSFIYLLSQTKDQVSILPRSHSRAPL